MALSTRGSKQNERERELTENVEFVADEESKAGVAGSGHGRQGLPAISGHIVAQHVVLGVCVDGHSSHHYHLVICTHQRQVHRNIHGSCDRCSLQSITISRHIQ